MKKVTLSIPVKDDIATVIMDRKMLLCGAPAEPTPCFVCKKVTINRCSACKLRYFCSKKCLKKIWPKHKKECKYFQAARDREQKKEQSKGTMWGLWYDSEYSKRHLYPLYPKREIFENHTNKDRFRQLTHSRIHLYKWLEDVAKKYKLKVNYEMDKRITTWEQYDILVTKCYSSTKDTIYCLTFDLRKEWCVVKANELAAAGNALYREQLPGSHMGYWVVVYDSYAGGSLLTVMPNIKASIVSIFESLGNPHACPRCKLYKEYLSTVCNECHLQACNTCVEERRAENKKLLFSCWDCGKHSSMLGYKECLELPHIGRIRDMLLFAKSDAFIIDEAELMPHLITKWAQQHDVSEDELCAINEEVVSMLASKKRDMHIERLKKTEWIVGLQKQLQQSREKHGVVLDERGKFLYQTKGEDV